MLAIALKDYRCRNCQKLFFKAIVYHAIIEVKCKNCKIINVIQNNDYKLRQPAEGQELHKMCNDSQIAPEKNIVVEYRQCNTTGCLCKKV